MAVSPSWATPAWRRSSGLANERMLAATRKQLLPQVGERAEEVIGGHPASSNQRLRFRANLPPRPLQAERWR